MPSRGNMVNSRCARAARSGARGPRTRKGRPGPRHAWPPARAAEGSPSAPGASRSVSNAARCSALTASDSWSLARVITAACSGLSPPEASRSRVAACSGSASAPAKATSRRAAPGATPCPVSHASVLNAPTLRAAPRPFGLRHRRQPDRGDPRLHPPPPPGHLQRIRDPGQALGGGRGELVDRRIHPHACGTDAGWVAPRLAGDRHSMIVVEQVFESHWYTTTFRHQSP